MEKQDTKKAIDGSLEDAQSPLIGLYSDAGFTADDSRDLLASTSAT